jgi:hypothetical protein
MVLEGLGTSNRCYPKEEKNKGQSRCLWWLIVGLEIYGQRGAQYQVKSAVKQVARRLKIDDVNMMTSL